MFGNQTIFANFNKFKFRLDFFRVLFRGQQWILQNAMVIEKCKTLIKFKIWLFLNLIEWMSIFFSFFIWKTRKISQNFYFSALGRLPFAFRISHWAYSDCSDDKCLSIESISNRFEKFSAWAISIIIEKLTNVDCLCYATRYILKSVC